MATLHDDDRELVRRLLAGEEQAFDEFFETYGARLYRFALSRLNRDEQTAEDVVQAALSLAIRKLSTYRGEAALFTWLCTLCRHELSAHYRARRRFEPESTLLEDTPEIRAALESLSSRTDGPDESLRHREVAALVRMALDYLPDRYGDALEWKYVLELSVKEIAARLQVTPKAAESILSRAREAFRSVYASLHQGVEGPQT